MTKQNTTTIKIPETPDHLKDLFPTAISYVVLTYKALDSHLKLRIIQELEAEKKHHLSKQELFKRLKLKHYKNFHQAIKDLEEIKLVNLFKIYDVRGQPVMVHLNTTTSFALAPVLDDLYRKHRLN